MTSNANIFASRGNVRKMPGLGQNRAVLAETQFAKIDQLGVSKDGTYRLVCRLKAAQLPALLKTYALCVDDVTCVEESGGYDMVDETIAAVQKTLSSFKRKDEPVFRFSLLRGNWGKVILARPGGSMSNARLAQPAFFICDQIPQVIN